MALHDWSHAPANVFHNFHVLWLAALSAELNRSVLPEGYLARAEEHVWPYEADVLAVDLRGGAEPVELGASDLVPTMTIAEPRLRTPRERRIAILSDRGERRVAIIEIVSPGNKDSLRRATAFRAKLVECIEAGLHALVVDLLPATGAVSGFGAEIARELGAAAGLATYDRYASSFESRRDPWEVRVYHQALVVGRELPDAPLFLDPGVHVMAPLQRTYQQAVEGIPAVDRALLS